MNSCGTLVILQPDTYTHYEKRSRSRYNRICIDGAVVGCSKCVGYCCFNGHPGFLTAKQRQNHKCIEKGCHYYVEKPARERVRKVGSSPEKQVFGMACELTKDMEGLRVMGTCSNGQRSWNVNYITISNEYALQPVQRTLEEMLDCKVTFVQLNYSFERCVELILAG